MTDRAAFKVFVCIGLAAGVLWFVSCSEQPPKPVPARSGPGAASSLSTDQSLSVNAPARAPARPKVRDTVRVDMFRFTGGADSAPVKHNIHVITSVPRQERAANGAVSYSMNPMEWYYGNELMQRLQSTGIKTDPNGDHTLKGEFQEFLADDEGDHVDWSLKVHYVFLDADGKQVYESTQTTQVTIPKSTPFADAADSVVQANTSGLLQDQSFIQAITDQHLKP